MTTAVNMTELIILPLAATLILSLTTGPLGCFLVWRKMAYFGDALAHAGVLGIALSMLLAFNQSIGIFLTCVLIAASFSYLHLKKVSSDSALGIIAHGGLAFGLLLIGAFGNSRIRLESMLLGDLLSVTKTDLALLIMVNILLFALLWASWKKLLLSTIDEDLAKTESVRPALLQFVLTLFIAGTIALGIKLVGALLISALLIIPASAARQVARSPESMAALAMLVGALSSALGILLSLNWDLAPGPAIVGIAVLFFLLSGILARAKVR